MESFRVKSCRSINGSLKLSGDKSIAHRSIILASLSEGKTTIKNFPANKDCLYTVSIFKNLGVKIKKNPDGSLTVFGKGLSGLKKPHAALFTGESGTTFRLLLGVLAGQDFPATLTCGGSLSRRPMLRVTAPLRKMGAKINAKRKTQNAKREEYPPITIHGGHLKGITYRMSVPSAQVKSAILLAGLFAKGRTVVIERLASRDHTERMLRAFGARIKPGKKIIISQTPKLVSPRQIYIPADISSASFFIVAALILPDSRVVVSNVSLNPSRCRALAVLRRMGADIRITAAVGHFSAGEPLGEVEARSSSLKAARVSKKEVPFLIDELPILMVAASFAKGQSVFQGVQELRVKETDRIKSMSENLRRMGVTVKVRKTGRQEQLSIRASGPLSGCKIKSFSDHRTAMSMAIAALGAEGSSTIDNTSCISKSFPDFLKILKSTAKFRD
ncbi:MAG: 3-phosphoshikimate 1-carboxyvinyltransferase [Candidatus Omnitrophica bacterium]|nr:3-phosphoshikimate 1-carboxyvinyltransferase [Candidatus Omnitrophota bacterium]